MKETEHVEEIPPQLQALARGCRQRRWLAALLRPEGLHHSEGKRGRWAGALHADIARFVHRLRCSGWEVRCGRLARGTDRYWLDPSDFDRARGEAFAALGQGADAELVGLLRTDAALRERALLLAERTAGWCRLSAAERVEAAHRLTASQAEIVSSLAVSSTLSLENLIDAAQELG